MLSPKALLSNSDAWKAGLRFAVAGGLAYAVAEYFKLPQGFWSVVTAIILIQQPRIGGTVQASIDRVIGTIAGAVVGFIIASLTPSTKLGSAFALTLSVGVLGLLASGRPSFRVAPITAAIVILSPSSHAVAWISAFHRVIEILVGSVIGVTVSLLVAPTRSETSMRQESSHALALLAQLIALALDKQEGKPADEEIARLSKELDKSFHNIATIGKEVQGEEASHFSRSSLDPICLRLELLDLRTAVFVLLSLARKPWPEAIRDTMVGPTRSMADAICDYMLALGATLTSAQPSPPKDKMDTAFVAFSSAAATWVETWHTARDSAQPGKSSKDALADPPALDGTAPSYIANVSFALEQLRYVLDKLTECTDGTSTGADRTR